MQYHSTYKKCDIFIRTEVGYQPRWMAYCTNGFLYADTLAGMKNLITQKKGVKYD
jgi:hypothetical protein